MKELTYTDAPGNWALCFQNDCPMCDTCLRYAVGKLTPASVTRHKTVLPTARREDGCRHYVEAKRVLIARGMTNLYKDLKRWEAEELRSRVKRCFSSRMQYYRHRKGIYPITPEMQANIARIFSDFKPGLQPHFDDLTETFYFPAP